MPGQQPSSRCSLVLLSHRQRPAHWCLAVAAARSWRSSHQRQSSNRHQGLRPPHQVEAGGASPQAPVGFRRRQRQLPKLQQHRQRVNPASTQPGSASLQIEVDSLREQLRTMRELYETTFAEQQRANPSAEPALTPSEIAWQPVSRRPLLNWDRLQQLTRQYRCSAAFDFLLSDFLHLYPNSVAKLKRTYQCFDQWLVM